MHEVLILGQAEADLHAAYCWFEAIEQNRSLPLNAAEPIREGEHSRGPPPNLSFGGFPIDKLFLARLSFAAAFVQHFPVPRRRGDIIGILAQIFPEHFHELKLFRDGHVA